MKELKLKSFRTERDLLSFVNSQEFRDAYKVQQIIEHASAYSKFTLFYWG